MRARNSGSRCFRERARRREFISFIIGDVPITLARDEDDDDDDDDVDFSFIICTSLTQSRDGNYRIARVITISREKETMPLRAREFGGLTGI